jgi:hypothetical protein
MIEVYPRLFVGDATSAAVVSDKSDWFVISAAKEPFHRQALGYRTPGAPKDSEEYLIARRPGRLILNLVDVDNVAYIREEIINTALREIDHQLADGKKVLIHCNQGRSRAPTIALLYLHQNEADYMASDHVHAAALFAAQYPAYAPAKGMAEYARQHWNDAHATR